MLAVAASVRGIDLTLPLFLGEPAKGRPQGLAAVCVAASGDESVQHGQISISQTNWDLSCHTISIPLARALERPERRDRAHWLAGDLGDQVEVPVVMADGDARDFRSRGDEQIRELHLTMMERSVRRELFEDVQSAPPRRLVDRQLAERFEACATAGETSGVPRLPKQL